MRQETEMPENTDTPPPLGRRERKRLETRNGLAAVALELFGERGFDAVTVNDIADQADVDPSTFYRHFVTKEAVIFAEFGEATARIGDAIRSQPANLPVLEALGASGKELAATLPIDLDNDRRRTALVQSTPSVRAQGLAVREALIEEMALAIADRMGVDPAHDSRPYLLAGSYVLASTWYRNHAVRTGELPSSADEAVDRIVDLVRDFVAVFARTNKKR
jgi:AcrR family transcriptional regulator